MVMVTSDWIGLAVAIGTISLAVVAFISIRHARDAQKREHKQRLLNEIANWASAVRAYCSGLAVGFNTSVERIEHKEKYWVLKFNGKKLITQLKSVNLSSDLLNQLKKAIEYFKEESWDKLANDKAKQAELRKSCETIIEKSFELSEINL